MRDRASPTRLRSCNAAATCSSPPTLTILSLSRRLAMSQLSKALSDIPPNRPASQPPLASAFSTSARTSLLSNTRPSSIPPGRGHAHKSEDNSMEATSLDLTDLLQRSEPSVVKTRSGSVLSRGFILKTDHYPSGESLYLCGCIS